MLFYQYVCTGKGKKKRQLNIYISIYISEIFFTIYHLAHPEAVLLAFAPSYQCLSLTTAVPMIVSRYKYIW